jgi:SpoVK/Ycf46/Vps4 family AAA+-type ATPase
MTEIINNIFNTLITEYKNEYKVPSDLKNKTSYSIDDKKRIISENEKLSSQILDKIEKSNITNTNSKKSDLDESVDEYKPKDTSKINVTFKSIKGNEKAKKTLQESYIKPFYYTKLFPIKTKGIILYGPPGTGKTLLAKACARELKNRVHFFSESATTMTSSYKGRSSKMISRLFSDAKALAESNDNNKNRSIIFLDEFDAIARSRDQGGSTEIVTTLLQEMDGFGDNSSVSVIAATNYPWTIDDAILSRFTSKIFCDLPSHDAVVGIMQHHMAKNLFIPRLVCGMNKQCNTNNSERQGFLSLLQQQIQKSCGINLKIKCEPDCKNKSAEEKYEYFYCIFDKKQLQEIATQLVTTKETYEYINRLQKKDEIEIDMSKLNFGRSGRDISRIIDKAINLAAEDALKRNIWYDTDIKMSDKDCRESKTIIISIVNNDDGNLTKNKIITELKDEHKTRCYNFIICPNHIQQAINEVNSSLNSKLYLELLTREKNIPEYCEEKCQKYLPPKEEEEDSLEIEDVEEEPEPIKKKGWFGFSGEDEDLKLSPELLKMKEGIGKDVQNKKKEILSQINNLYNSKELKNIFSSIKKDKKDIYKYINKGKRLLGFSGEDEDEDEYEDEDVPPSVLLQMQQKIQKDVENNNKLIENKIKEILEIPHIHDLYDSKDLSTIFSNIPTHKKSIYKRYVEIGCELNEQMRAGKANRQTVSRIEESFVPAKDLFKKNKLFYVFRSMTREYVNSITGFQSSSNYPLQGFGTIRYKVIIMPNTKIGFYDISKATNKSETYEIIISKDQKYKILITNTDKYLVPTEML